MARSSHSAKVPPTFRTYLNGRYLMPVCQWQALMLVLFVLGGCNTNHVFDNGDYRPLGDPQSISRGQ